MWISTDRKSEKVNEVSLLILDPKHRHYRELHEYYAQPDKSVKLVGSMWNEYKTHASFIIPAWGRHPDQWALISSIASKHNLSVIRISLRNYTGPAELHKIRETLNGVKVQKFSLEINCERRWEAADHEALVQLVHSTKAAAISLNSSPQLIRNGLTIGKFMRACTPTLREFSSNDRDYVDSINAPFHFLSILTQYNHLNVPSLTIQPLWIGQACMMLLDRMRGHRRCTAGKYRRNREDIEKSKIAVSWRIGIPQQPTPQQFSQMISSPEYMYMRDDKLHSIVKTSDLLTADVTFSPFGPVFLLNIRINLPCPVHKSMDCF